MDEVGIRALKQNASAVVAAAAAGDAVTITDRGRPVAAIVPLATDPLDRLIDAGRARPARTHLADLVPPDPPARDEGSLTDELMRDRTAGRY